MLRFFYCAAATSRAITKHPASYGGDRTSPFIHSVPFVTLTQVQDTASMPKTTKPQILLTNDDGIQSPGLWAAAGRPGRRRPRHRGGARRAILRDGPQPAQHVQRHHPRSRSCASTARNGPSTPSAVRRRRPSSTLCSRSCPRSPIWSSRASTMARTSAWGPPSPGTVGAAMEAASLGIPALGISLEAAQQYHLSYSNEIDFSAAAHFAAFFGRLLLKKKMPHDVDLLKVDVPSDATPETPWVVTCVARQGYYEPLAPKRTSWNVAAPLGYKEAAVLDGEDEDSDVVVLRRRHMVAVTPISLDMTSRVEAVHDLDKHLRA